MNGDNLCNRPTDDTFADDDRIMIIHEGKAHLSTLEQIKEYMGKPETPADMGVPEPKADDVGKHLIVCNDGFGFSLLDAGGAALLWKNEDISADFPAQTIASDNTEYCLFVVSFWGSLLGVRHGGSVIVSKGETAEMITIGMTVSNDPPEIRSEKREVKADDTGFVFGPRVYKSFDTYNGYYVSSHYPAIGIRPTAIYGIRRGR